MNTAPLDDLSLITNSPAARLTRAGRWFLRSGIQHPGGGVARFYLAEVDRNRAISTEITGYTASALMYLYEVTGDQAYLDRARQTAKFLAHEAWDRALGNIPFEYGPGAEHMLYFFDCGIITRGLLAVWRQTREQALLDRAVECGHAMLRDFEDGCEIHPILGLPDRKPIARDWRWSRNPGCYQLKSALAWHDLAEITGDSTFARAFDRHLQRSLATYDAYLPGHPEPDKVMDRLHPFLYFLEALLSSVDDACADQERCALALADGIARVGRYVREIAPRFVRSDVYAQLLRVRLWASATLPLDVEAAQQEAEALAVFQLRSPAPRLDGGFVFGARLGEMIPHVNPVSTAFALQALHMWHTRELPPLSCLI